LTLGSVNNKDDKKSQNKEKTSPGNNVNYNIQYSVHLCTLVKTKPAMKNCSCNKTTKKTN